MALTDKDLPTLLRMRKAEVPIHAYAFSLKTLGQLKLHEIIQAKAYDLGIGGSKSYIISDRLDTAKPKTSAQRRPNVTEVCAVAAKQLVLQKVMVRYKMLPSLVKSARQGELEDCGQGFIVVGDLGQNTQEYPKDAWLDVQDLLLSHVNRGGALILGDTGVVQDGFLSWDFIDNLTAFDAIPVE